MSAPTRTPSFPTMPARHQGATQQAGSSSPRKPSGIAVGFSFPRTPKGGLTGAQSAVDGAAHPSPVNGSFWRSPGAGNSSPDWCVVSGIHSY